MKEWFYTKDGQQQGPVSFEQLKMIASEGSINPAAEMAWRSGMSDWQPMSSIEGLAGAPAAVAAPAADPSNPYAAPASGWVSPEVTAGSALEEIEPGSDPIGVGDCVKRGFELTKRNFGTIFLVGITYLAVAIAASAVFTALDSALGFTPAPNELQIDKSNGISRGNWSATGPIDGILSQLLSIFLALGLVRIGLNLVSGQDVSVSMLFSGGRKLLPAIGASILFGLMVGVGFILLVVPGVYLLLRYGQFMNAMVDRDLGVIDSLKYSSSITTNNRLNLFLLALLSIAIFIAGALALIVGLIFAYPVIWLGWMVAFRWMQYGNRVTQDHPGTKVPLLRN